MFYEAKLTFGDTAAATGRAAKDHDAIEFALKDSITLREAPPSQVIVAVYMVTSNDRDLRYVTTLRQYRQEVA